MSDDTREKGTIVYLNDDRGYGFIEVPRLAKSVFFHAKDLRHIPFEKIRKGDTVEIEGIRSTEKGFNASAVFLTS